MAEAGRACSPGGPSSLSTGEQAATSFTSHQGASARVLSVQQAPFGTDGTTSRDAAEGVKAGIEANFGTAGPAFVAHLQRQLAKDGGLAELRTRHRELTELLRGGTDMTGRRAPLIATLALAAELAAEWELIPFSAPDVPAWLALFASADPRDDRSEMAVDIVREFVAARVSDLWYPGRRDHPPRGCHRASLPPGGACRDDGSPPAGEVAGTAEAPGVRAGRRAVRVA